MKIVVLLSRIPWPLEKGDKLRGYNQIKSLSKDNEVYLIALHFGKGIHDEAYSKLNQSCKEFHIMRLSLWRAAFNILLAFFKGLPLQCGFFYNKSVHKQIHSCIEAINPDVIYGQLIRVATYIEHESIPKVLDYQDVLSMGMKRRMETSSIIKKPIYRTEYKRLQSYERRLFEVFDATTIIAQSDRDLIDHPKNESIVIVPNGVDLEVFVPQLCEKKYDLAFCGNMAYAPNINAVEFLAKEILPIVWNTLPDVNLCIAGATPSPKVKSFASEKIIVTGWVEKMQDIYAQSQVFIAPMRIGTGLQNKLLEAMAMEIPCITTNLANGSLQATDGREILVGNSAQEIADLIIRLLTQVEFATNLAKNGNEFVRDHYDWDATTLILKNVIKSVTQTR